MAEHAKHDLIWARNNAAPGEEKPVVQMTWAKFKILSKGGNGTWEQVDEPNGTSEADAPVPAPSQPQVQPSRARQTPATQDKETV